MFEQYSVQFLGWVAVFGVSAFVVCYYSFLAVIESRAGSKLSEGGGRRSAEGLEFFEQISPFIGALRGTSRVLLSSMSSKDINEIQAKIREAGLTTVISLEEFIGMRIFGALSGMGLGFLMFLMSGLHPMAALGGMLFAMIGWIYPNNWINGVARVRQVKIFRGLSDTLDVLAVSVGAGLEMRQALERVVEIGSEPELDIEINRTLQEIDKGGKSLEKGFEDLRERVSSPEMTAFVNVMLMAFRLGAAGMAGILSEQAGAIRKERVLRAERQANQMGSKILFPIAVFIFPAVIVTLLGPLVLEAFLSFGVK